MEDSPDKFVYHGSHEKFEPILPRRNIRSRINNTGEREVIFDEVSFHATPYRWIALAYTYNNKKTCVIDGKEVYYNMGVDLYEHNNELCIYGIGSLEQSLEQLYGDGGYTYITYISHNGLIFGLGDDQRALYHGGESTTFPTMISTFKFIK